MNPEIKTKWVEALRSDEYKQGAGYLHYGDDEGASLFCCLGVLCDIAVKEGVLERQYHTDEGLYLYGPDRDEMVLPTAVQKWAGLDDSNPEFVMDEFDDEPRALADLNDSEGWSFEQIADLIEKRL